MNAVAHDPMADLAAMLAEGSGAAPSAAFDARIDVAGEDASLAAFVRHQALMRGYQARYVLLPEAAPAGGVLGPLARHYDAGRLARLAELRPRLETELIGPLALPGEGEGEGDIGA